MIKGPGKGAVNCSLKFMPRTPGDKFNVDKLAASYQMFKSHIDNIKITADTDNLTYSCNFTKAYPGSIHELEGLAYVTAETWYGNTPGNNL